MSISKVPVVVGIIGGTGLDNPNVLQNQRVKRVSETPYGRPSDDLLIGEIGDVPVVLLARHGRKHDIMPGNVNYRANIWALMEEGCTHIIASTATGSLDEGIRPGDLLVPDSFIDRTQGRKQTFYDGQPGHPAGICHLQMEPAFCEELRELVINTAADMGIAVHKSGTVVAIEGPRFSSRAESLMYQKWGAHIVNMTMVPEVILAKEAGICYASVALVTDYDCWRLDTEHVCLNDVLNTFRKNCNKILKLLIAVIPKIAEQDWQPIITGLKENVKNSTML